MSRSNPTHRKPNDIFIINLKMKLHLELFDLGNCPQCKCGSTIDPFGQHIFCCRRVSKKVAHDRISIRDGMAPFVRTILILITTGHISTGSPMEVEPKRVLPDLPGLRPFGLAFWPVPSFSQSQ